ncbi:DUF3995 domain-containing protein [Lichenicoccus sp.]|uniref:DUF3995 domain-containing protein n=1 Tax=Lichenicoccus sp. TaxID=2781899 RepID=UPI003D0A57F0
MIGAVAGVAILLSLATLHLYWAVGGTFGKGAAIPERNGKPVLRPSPTGTLVVAVGIYAIAILVAARVGWFTVPNSSLGLRVAVWLAAGVFAARAVGDFRYVGFFKRVRGTRFARFDTRYYSPLCCLLALLLVDAAVA